VIQAKRVGLLLPSSNTVQEPEFYRSLPPGFTLHATRLVLQNIEANSTLEIGAQVEEGARRLAHADVDLIVLAATAPSTRKGIGYDRELSARISAASGKPATTAATAMLEAFQELKVRRVVLGAPWSDEVNATTAQFIEQNGFEVIGRKALGIVANREVGRLDSHTAYEVGRQIVRADADAIMLACGNWSTFPIIEKLERAINRPVLTTNQVSLWHTLRLLGAGPIEGLGLLLQQHLGTAAAAAVREAGHVH
jgi:maleate isomerase